MREGHGAAETASLRCAKGVLGANEWCLRGAARGGLF